jgi:hypothetical protein
MKTMKILAATTTLLTALIGRARAQGSDDFTFYNHTGSIIVALYLSPHDQDSWLRNVLRQRLPNNSHTEVFWYEEPYTHYFDIKIEYANGSTNSFTDGLDLSQLNTIAVTQSGTHTIWHWE